MKNMDKSKEELIKELNALEKRVAALEEKNEILNENNRFYKGIIDSITEVALIAIDEEGIISLFNGGAQRMLGYSADEIVGKKSPIHFHLPVELARMSEGMSMAIGRPVEGFEMFEIAGRRPGNREQEWTYVRKNGSNLRVRLSLRGILNKEGNLIGRLGVAQDVTDQKRIEEERRKLEDQLNQAQKMEAIGTLAGGIAHDFNNILSIIFGYSELADDDIPFDHPAHNSLVQIVKAANKAKDLVQQILTFSRQGNHELKPFKLSLMVKEAVQMLRSTIPSTIQIKSNISSQTGIVLADPTQIHQVLMNLCVNAGHAMKETSGTLTISLNNTQIEKDSPLNDGLELESGNYMALIVEDTGHGISQENIKRIFDPYFTTKRKEEGTGLGLAVVHGIIKKHDGDITVQSEVGKGSIFTVYLPLSRFDNREAKVPGQSEIPIGLEHILLVDDEQALVETSRLQLKKLGYKVTARSSSVDALEYFKHSKDHVDILLTDYTMPNMTGLQLARELQALQPGLPVILLTGFSESIEELNLKDMGIAALVMKPFVRKDIAKVIRDVLDKNKLYAISPKV
jgi:PAS domain S-box-containing protein